MADEEKQTENTGDKLGDLQKDVDETAELMKDNIEKVVDRGDKLEDLEQRTDDLEATTKGFKTTAGKMALKYYWRNTKVKLCIAGSIIAIILVIILIIVLVTKPWESDSSENGASGDASPSPSPTALLSSTVAGLSPSTPPSQTVADN